MAEVVAVVWSRIALKFLTCAVLNSDASNIANMLLSGLVASLLAVVTGAFVCHMHTRDIPVE